MILVRDWRVEDGSTECHAKIHQSHNRAGSSSLRAIIHLWRNDGNAHPK